MLKYRLLSGRISFGALSADQQQWIAIAIRSPLNGETEFQTFSLQLKSGQQIWLLRANYRLTVDYVPTRYPNSIPDNIPARVYTAEAAQGAVALAREVVAWVQAHMTYGMWQSHAERLIGMRTCLSP